MAGRPRQYDRTRTCSRCGVTYEGYPGKPKGKKLTFCGRECATAYLVERNRTDREHQSRAGKIGGRVRGEQRRAERSTDWYVKQDGRHVHRTVAEAVLGRTLRPGEVVHHEDQNKLNNHPANLIVFPSQSEHVRHHSLGHLGKQCDCEGIRLKEVMA